jgi:hypothetical protein
MLIAILTKYCVQVANSYYKSDYPADKQGRLGRVCLGLPWLFFVVLPKTQRTQKYIATENLSILCSSTFERAVGF